MKRLFSLVTIALCSIFTTFAEQIKVPDIALARGSSAIVEILLRNERTNLVAFQMDLTLPEGIGIDKTGCKLSSRITDREQDLVIGKLESGVFRLTSTSMSLTPISGTEGALLILKLCSEDSFVKGQAVIGNICFATSESERIIVDDVSFTINTKYKLTYMIDDKVYKDTVYEYGATIVPEPIPEGDYASFEWVELPETMPAHDVTVHASYVTGITDISMKEMIVRIYTPNGKVLNKLQKGLNLVFMRDGTIRKIVIK